MKKLFFLLAVVGLMFTACNDNGVDQGDEQQNPPEQPGNGNGDQGGEEIPEDAIIADENNTFNLPVEGGSVELAYQTSVECEVVIPSDAQHWISLAPETRGLVSGSATLNIAKSNTGVERSAVVKVVKVGDQSVFAEYTIAQECNMDYIILYTTTDGNTIRPKNFDYLTNTYEDGVGMLAFDGSKVTSIGDNAFYECTSLTSITIPESVTSIGPYAFRGCTSLTSVTIPDSVTSIGGDAFSYCTSLASITIPNSVTSIETRAFYDCTSLKSITIPESVTSIGFGAFYNCNSLTSITIPNSVTSIGSSAFYNCTSLTSVTIPDSVTSIGYSTFQNCTALTSITIPNSVTSISYRAFQKCTSLTSITIPESVNSIGENAFEDCTGELIINSYYLIDMDYGAYNDNNCPSKTWLNGSKFTKLTIGDNIVSIGKYAFYGCSSLTSVTISNSVTWIGDRAFSRCSSLKRVYCKPTTPPTIGYDVFAYNASGIEIWVASFEYYEALRWSDYASEIVVTIFE